MKDQTLALAGLFQAAFQARGLAREGRLNCDESASEASIQSIFELRPESPIKVFGSVAALRPGLEQVLLHLDTGPRDPDVLRYAVSLVHLRTRLMARDDIVELLRQLIEESERQRVHLGTTHPQTLSRLADVYQQTISTLGHRVVVRGEGQFLQQPQIVAHIRALLLAGIRAAVLWHQVGGRRRFLLTRRSSICRECRQILSADA